MKNLETLLDEILANKTLISAVLSSPRVKGPIEKKTFRPVEVKGQLLYQATDTYAQKVLHSNYSAAQMKKVLLEALPSFKQGVIFTAEADYHLLVDKSGDVTVHTKAPTRLPVALAHNRKKKYLLEEGVPLPFLVECGLMTSDGKVVSKMRDKFKQINRFLEMIEDILPHLQSQRRLHIVDFGCGKSYLTFALYHYLSVINGFKLNVVGLDLKEDVITRCQALSDSLGYTNLKFAVGDIQSHVPEGKIDLVVSLHACDTATDAAIEKAVLWDADVILAVPCCQHELFSQVRSTELSSILEFGILKERFAAMATDAARAKILQILGYHTQVLEFIDMEHTPKNILIRAVKDKISLEKKSAYKAEYLRLKQALHIKPSLESAFHKELFA